MDIFTSFPLCSAFQVLQITLLAADYMNVLSRSFSAGGGSGGFLTPAGRTSSTNESNHERDLMNRSRADSRTGNKLTKNEVSF